MAVKLKRILLDRLMTDPEIHHRLGAAYMIHLGLSPSGGRYIGPSWPEIQAEYVDLLHMLDADPAELDKMYRERNVPGMRIHSTEYRAILATAYKKKYPGKRIRTRVDAGKVEVRPVGKRLRQEEITSMIVELQKSMGESIADFATPAKMAGLLAARFKIKAPSKNTVAKNIAFKAMIRCRGRPRGHHEDDDE